MRTNADVAVRLLKEAALYFQALGDGDPGLEPRVGRIAQIYRRAAAGLVEAPQAPALDDPDGLDLLSLNGARPHSVAAPGEAEGAALADTRGPAALGPPILPGVAARLSPGLLEAAPPPFEGDWRPLAEADAHRLIEKVSRQLTADGVTAPWPLSHDQVALRCVRAPFYGEALLADAVVSGRTGDLGHAAFIVLPTGVKPLGVYSDRVHDLNEIVPVRLSTEAEATAYLRYFCWVVCGDAGPFQIIESEAALAAFGIDSADVDAEHLRVTAEAVTEPDVGWSLKALVRYADEVYAARFHLWRNGMIEMIDDSLVAPTVFRGRSWVMEGDVRYRQVTDA